MINEEVHLQSSLRPISFRMNFDLDRAHDRNVWLHLRTGHGYEPEVCHALLRFLRSGDRAIDIGANFGYFTLLMSKLVGPGGHVTAVEAAEIARASLQGNLVANDASNVFVYAGAAAKQSGEATFFLSSDDPAGSCLWDPGNWFENRNSKIIKKAFRALTFALDDLEFSQLRLIKSDTEGAEHDIFKGAKDTLTRLKPAIVMELNPFGMTQMGTSTEELRAYLAGFGYSMFFLHANGSLPSLVPRGTKVVYERQWCVKNCLFSTPEQVAEAWPEAGD